MIEKFLFGDLAQLERSLFRLRVALGINLFVALAAEPNEVQPLVATDDRYEEQQAQRGPQQRKAVTGSMSAHSFTRLRCGALCELQNER